MTRLARSFGVALVGLKGVPVEVQTHIGPGIVGTTLVGLPDASLRESKERVRAALFSCGVPGLNRRVTVNLSPADLPKAGSAFDLAIAVSMLVARDLLPDVAAQKTVFVAELGLDGELAPVPGVLPSAIAARDAGFDRILVPDANRAEAELAGGIQVSSCSHLKDLLMTFRTDRPWEVLDSLAPSTQEALFGAEGANQEAPAAEEEWVDLSDVRGQTAAVRALTVAAVGGHHVLLHGPAGAGKTMLAARLHNILPPLDHADALAVTALRSLAYSSTVNERVTDLITKPPLEAPNHSATMVSLVGGGNPIRPGAISLAHGGVLMLDEAPEFPRRVLDSLRQPLDGAEIVIHRAQSRAAFPARFQLVLTANPCPCGGDGGTASGQCQCQPLRVRHYRNRLSGPLLDRIDVMVRMGRPTKSELVTQEPAPTSARTQEAVIEARERSRKRLEGTPWSLNAEVPGRFLRENMSSSKTYVEELEKKVVAGALSLRGADRVLRLAWSVADLNGHDQPTPEDYLEAMDYRGVTRGENSWI